EDMDTLLDAEYLLRHWRAQPAQPPELAALLGELETLGAGARQAELAQIDALCQALLALYGAVQAGHLSLGERFFDEAEAAHEALIGMLDQVAAALEVTPQPERVAALQALLDETAAPRPLELEEGAAERSAADLARSEPELAEPTPAQPEPAIAEPLEVLLVEMPGLAAAVPESEASIPALYELDLAELDASEAAAELAEPSSAPAIAEPLEVLPVEPPRLAVAVPESGAVIPALQPLELAAPELPALEPAPAVPEAAAVTPGILPGDGEVDDELAALFLEEALDLLESSAQTLQRWLRQPEDSLALTALLRDLHTLKGGARMAGIAPIADLAHELEDLYEALLEQARPDLAGLGALLERSHDRLAQLVEQLQARLPLGDPQDLVKALQGWRRQAAAFTPEACGVRAGVLEPVALEAFGEALSFAESFDLAADVPAFDRPLLDFSTGQDAPLKG
ncbi:Hpt domain-containing protein, partial [Azotobacter chroococcum]|nr:Hpt domain-containing protein [Azotobacter chroococcum]